MLSRRDVLKALAAMTASTFAFTGYAFAEALWLRVTRYAVSPPNWPIGLRLKIAVLTDIHACEPWMGEKRLRSLVERSNGLGADIILLLGDYVPGHGMMRFGKALPHRTWASILAGLKAPLGVHAVLGNHDWWDDPAVQRRTAGPTPAGLALTAAGIPVYENNAVRLVKDGEPFWIAGLGDQWAFWPRRADDNAYPGGGRIGYRGVHDVGKTLADVTDDAPIILMAHEPDIFPEIPTRVALTLSGHTHGGQLNLFGYTPIVPSKFGSRYVYGHIVEDGRNLIVSGGLGCSAVPMRIGSPPEIVLIELGGGAAA